jgi:cysteine desulfurase
LTAQIDGGGHERGRRSGTLNVPAIVGFGKACEICMETGKEEALRINDLRNKLEESLLTIEESFVNGTKEHRLPNVTNICFGHGQGESLMRNLGKQVAVSSGSACMSASLEPSYVLKALGLSDENARSSLRFSLGRYTTEEEVAYAVKQFENTAAKLRETGIQFKEKI